MVYQYLVLVLYSHLIASVFSSGVTQSVSSIVYNNECWSGNVTVAGSHGFRVGNVVNLGGS